jgi:MFS transporter, putative metabolite:H+ symporter
VGMSMSVNAGPRLDRLPIGSFHRRVMWLIGIGMFFDGFDIYAAATVLASTVQTGFSTLPQNALFISATFVGLMIGAFSTGFLGDRFGRRFTYQANLLIFGVASLAAAAAPNMETLIALRFIMAIGLGAENVVGYSTMTEFVPASSRGKWLGLMGVFVAMGLPAVSLLGYATVPTFGWRFIFVVGGLGALVVWYMRKSLPESPRWLEAVGRTEEAEALLCQIEAEAGRGQPLPEVQSQPLVPPVAIGRLLAPPMLQRLITGCVCVCVINALIYGFITFQPTFFVKQGYSIATSFGYTLLMAFGAPIGAAIGGFLCDSWGRKTTIIGASLLAIGLGLIYPHIHHPVLLPLVGFAFTVPIYVLATLIFAIYVPELFPTEIRLRAAGMCNTFGRAPTIVIPFVVVSVFNEGGISHVMMLMIALFVLQIVVVYFLGIEPARRRLEDMKVAI